MFLRYFKAGLSYGLDFGFGPILPSVFWTLAQHCPKWCLTLKRWFYWTETLWPHSDRANTKKGERMSTNFIDKLKNEGTELLQIPPNTCRSYKLDPALNAGPGVRGQPLPHSQKSMHKKSVTELKLHLLHPSLVALLQDCTCTSFSMSTFHFISPTLLLRLWGNSVIPQQKLPIAARIAFIAV